ncbi:unnamed protein product, partial [Rotaria sp. Silwood1]
HNGFSGDIDNAWIISSMVSLRVLIILRLAPKYVIEFIRKQNVVPVLPKIL